MNYFSQTNTRFKRKKKDFKIELFEWPLHKRVRCKLDCFVALNWWLFIAVEFLLFTGLSFSFFCCQDNERVVLFSGAWTIGAKGPWPPSEFGPHKKRQYSPLDNIFRPLLNQRGDPWLFFNRNPPLFGESPGATGSVCTRRKILDFWKRSPLTRLSLRFMGCFEETARRLTLHVAVSMDATKLPAAKMWPRASKTNFFLYGLIVLNFFGVWPSSIIQLATRQPPMQTRPAAFGPFLLWMGQWANGRMGEWTE